MQLELTIELALQAGDDEGNSLGSSSCGGHNVEGGSPGTAQVTVGGVQQPLVSSVGVGGCHGSLDNAELVVQNLQQTSTKHVDQSSVMGAGH